MFWLTNDDGVIGVESAWLDGTNHKVRRKLKHPSFTNQTTKRINLYLDSSEFFVTVDKPFTIFKGNFIDPVSKIIELPDQSYPFENPTAPIYYKKTFYVSDCGSSAALYKYNNFKLTKSI